jgi:hypothetical protein
MALLSKMIQMAELFDARDQLITEKSVLLEEREQMITAEIKQLKDDLEVQKEKTKAAEEIADKALEMGMKATKKWEKEKTKRKMAEEVLQGLQSILHDSVTAGLIPRYKKKPVQDEEFHSAEEEAPEEEPKWWWGYLQEHQDIEAPLQIEAPVQDLQVKVEEALPADLQVKVEEALPADLQEVQVKVEEALPADLQEVQVKVEEPVRTPVSAEDVILYHELKIVQINHIQWFTTDLVKAHCESRGISTNGKSKAQMLQELKDALNGTPSPLINAEGLVHLYEKKQQESGFRLSAIIILRLHCRYHGLTTIGTKAGLRETLRIHLG